MNSFLFRPDYMAQYYNCSGKTYDEWKALGQPNVILGFVYVLFSFIFLIILLPFMVVFVKTDLMKYSCYKIMFFLGIIDCIQLPVAGFFGGYAAAIGMVYCMAPTSNYIIGCIAMACWASGSTTCVLLAVNRCVDFINPELGNRLFSGKKTILWLLIPTTYFIYFYWFHTTAIFNSNLYAFFFDPFVGTPDRKGLIDSEHYPHLGQSIHNIIVVTTLIIAYSSLLVHLSVQIAKSANVTKMSKLQRQIFIQCVLVCSGTFVTALIYVYMQFFFTPVWIVVCGEIAWQVSHGAAGVSYAFLNTTMRREFIKIFCSGSKTALATVPVNTNRHVVPTSDHLSDLEF